MGNDINQIKNLILIAESYIKKKNFKHAKKYYLKALDENSKTLNSSFIRSQIMREIICISFALKELDVAYAMLKEQFFSINNVTEESKVKFFHDVGRILMEQGNDNAQHFLHKALQIQKNHQSEKIVKILIDLALVEMYRGDFDEAKKRANKAKTICKTINLEFEFASSLNILGLVNMKKGKFEKALFLFNQSLNIFKNLKKIPQVADTFDNLGILMRKQKQFKKSLTYHHIALCIRKKVNDEPALAKTYTNLGLAYKKIGKIDESLSWHSQSLVIREKFQDKVGIANSLNNIGVVLTKKGELNKSMRYFSKSLDIRKKIKDYPNAIKILQNISYVHNKSGSKSRSLKILKEAEDMVENLPRSSAKIQRKSIMNFKEKITSVLN
ncbi:tetratricopeptide repeat protein [Nitrosopumilus sp. b2]|uniref:tetratricopeptide repeat protein n=1 Tax=Nitrosopumilus sp. b2 TaxID=2109908 RepID=UPI0015F55374|nr:tetratricopeptide repeat protein [Nitrosopumilus sp. b2]KAF6244920.1 hypothetical protein C6989_05945 [Nitrosopumilus sp. b2]